MDKCPDGNGEPSCDTAPPRRAVGDAHRLLVKLVRGYHGIPGDRNPYVLSLVHNGPSWVQSFYES